MAIMLQENSTEGQSSVVSFLWAKGLIAKDIHKELLPGYGGKYLSCKAVRKWVDKFSQGRSKVANVASPGAEVSETTVKRLLCCGFRRTGKAMGQGHQIWWRICREINVVSMFEYVITCFTFYIHL
jgi:hypothetical protein